MYRITEGNTATPLTVVTMKDEQLSERKHLQQWIIQNPNCLGEELLIISEEFDGFDGTWERLDLLALDLKGNLVIIENKRDNTGKNVTWQAVKYASYCSKLTKSDIETIFRDFLQKSDPQKDSLDVLANFFNRNNYAEIELNTSLSQRIILVASSFPIEVTSTVLWLNEKGLDISCINYRLFKAKESLFVYFDKLIPIPGTEQLQIDKLRKRQESEGINFEKENADNHRKEFWANIFPLISGPLGLSSWTFGFHSFSITDTPMKDFYVKVYINANNARVSIANDTRDSGPFFVKLMDAKIEELLAKRDDLEYRASLVWPSLNLELKKFGYQTNPNEKEIARFIIESVTFFKENVFPILATAITN
jgi:hypothetical protein